MLDILSDALAFVANLALLSLSGLVVAAVVCVAAVLVASTYHTIRKGASR